MNMETESRKEKEMRKACTWDADPIGGFGNEELNEEKISQ